MKSLVGVLSDLLSDAGEKCSASVSRDLETLRERVEHEGDSFITVTLPRFCRDFERSLDESRVVPGSFAPFKKRSRSGIPAFMSEFLHQVFDRKTGCLLASPSIDCIQSIRAICLFGKKIMRECTQARTRAAVDAYRQCDDEVVTELSGQLWRYFGRVADFIVGELFPERDGGSIIGNLRPHHGPGATREGIVGNDKWRFRGWPRRLEDVGITYWQFGHGSSNPYDWMFAEAWPGFVEPEQEPPVKVVFVPKTQTSPRVIAVEPVAFQYVQQGLKDVLVGALEKGPTTGGRILFRDQTVTQDAAREGSVGANIATLDLSEASDRVSVLHVARLFESFPELRDMIFACRSTRAQLPTGETITLRKFASMGSALTFPLEAMVFFIAIVAARIRRAGEFPTAHQIRKHAEGVHVYGDDLIVPAGEAEGIVEDLESLGFKVNRNKSFWTGKFRESCGEDSYSGSRVTPVYLRRDAPSGPSDASALLSLVATANQLTQAGYARAAHTIRKGVEKVLGLLPMLPEEHAGVGWVDNSNVDPPRRWNKWLQRFEIRVWVAETPKVDDPLSGDAAMLKCWSRVGKSVFTPDCLREWDIPHNDDHLDTSFARYSATLKRRWVPAPAGN